MGFIRRLPTQLVEGFAATLEETLVADLVLHVADASEADERLDEMRAAVESVLAEIGADELPVELVLNKIDAVDALRRRRLANRFPDALQVSALTGEGLDALRARLARDDRRAEREIALVGGRVTIHEREHVGRVIAAAKRPIERSALRTADQSHGDARVVLERLGQHGLQLVADAAGELRR